MTLYQNIHKDQYCNCNTEQRLQLFADYDRLRDLACGILIESVRDNDLRVIQKQSTVQPMIQALDDQY